MILVLAAPVPQDRFKGPKFMDNFLKEKTKTIPPFLDKINSKTNEEVGRTHFSEVNSKFLIPLQN
jgi:hypothetical protein